MSVGSDFKAFVMRGNVVDLAVGVIIGAAFGKIVSSMVDDVLMPPIGKLLGRVNFTDLFVVGDHSIAVIVLATLAAVLIGEVGPEVHSR